MDSLPYELILRIVQFYVATPRDFVCACQISRVWHALLQGHLKHLTESSRLAVCWRLSVRLHKKADAAAVARFFPRSFYHRSFHSLDEAEYLAHLAVQEQLVHLSVLGLLGKDTIPRRHHRQSAGLEGDAKLSRYITDDPMFVLSVSAFRLYENFAWLIVWLFVCVSLLHGQLLYFGLCLFLGSVFFVMLSELLPGLFHRALNLRVRSLCGSEARNLRVLPMASGLLLVLWSWLLMFLYFAGGPFLDWILFFLFHPGRLRSIVLILLSLAWFEITHASFSRVCSVAYKSWVGLEKSVNVPMTVTATLGAWRSFPILIQTIIAIALDICWSLGDPTSQTLRTWLCCILAFSTLAQFVTFLAGTPVLSASSIVFGFLWYGIGPAGLVAGIGFRVSTFAVAVPLMIALVLYVIRKIGSGSVKWTPFLTFEGTMRAFRQSLGEVLRRLNALFWL